MHSTIKKKPIIEAMSIVWRFGPTWCIYSVFFTVLLGFLPVTSLWISKELINQISSIIQKESEAYSVALFFLFLQFILVLLNAVISRIQEYLNRDFEIKLGHHLRKTTLLKATTVPPIYFDIPDFYNRLNRAGGQHGGRFLSPVRNILELSKNIISITSLLIFLLNVHWSLALISVVAAVPVYLIQSKIGTSKYWLMFYQTPTARQADYTSRLLENHQSIKEIRLFNLGTFLLQRWSNLFLKNANESLQLLKKEHWLKFALDILIALFYLGATIIMIWLTRLNLIKIGDFVAIGQAIQGVQSSINQFSSLLAKFQEDNLHLGDYFDFLNYHHDGLSISPGKRTFPTLLKEGIKVKNLSFRYPDDSEFIIRDVSFEIKPGEKVTIVGENGSGKTTLVKCLTGLYPITNGNIYFDGIEINELSLETLYSNTTVIFQDFMRYAFSVKDNIMFGNITEYDNRGILETAASQSGIDSVINRLHMGYETNLGRLFDKGVDLSGGQWQKIALSRALAKNSQIFILDEPTSSLDPLAEMEVFKQFEQMTNGRTTLFVSHRMAAARMADRILVMKNGTIVESGTHVELMELKEEYYLMYTNQAQWYS